MQCGGPSLTLQKEWKETLFCSFIHIETQVPTLELLSTSLTARFHTRLQARRSRGGGGEGRQRGRLDSRKGTSSVLFQGNVLCEQRESGHEEEDVEEGGRDPQDYRVLTWYWQILISTGGATKRAFSPPFHDFCSLWEEALERAAATAAAGGASGKCRCEEDGGGRGAVSGQLMHSATSACVFYLQL